MLSRNSGRTRACRPTAVSGCPQVLLLLAILAVGATSCATSSPATRAGMAPQDLPVQSPQPYSVRVVVRGGRETDPKGPTQISNQAFARAIADAIEQSRMFSKVLQRGNADYLLKVSILELEQSPPKGFSMTAALQARWTLSEYRTGESVWAETIHSSDTASAISSRKAVTRMRLATESAARQNIEQGMERLTRIELGKL